MCKDRDLSQSYIAHILNVGQKTYSDYELGKSRIPLERMIMLAQFYDVDMNYICGISEVKNTFPKE